MGLRLRFIGSGDAFGTGGRFNTCFMVDDDHGRFLIDCGASSLVGLKSQGFEPNDIDTILITHCHGDHFGGLTFFLMDGQYRGNRQTPLTIAGPPGIGRRITEVSNALFPGAGDTEWRYPVHIVELQEQADNAVTGRIVQPHRVEHPVGDVPPFALRVTSSGRTLTYTGDTQWTDALIPAAKGADLLISECYYADDRCNGQHLNWPTLSTKLDVLGAKRTILTHLGPQMLAQVESLGVEYAHDGKVVDL